MKNALILIVGFALLMFSCNKEAKKAESEDLPVIGKKNLKLNSEIMTPEVLWAFGRISEVQVSPDKKSLLLGISYYDIAMNKGNRDLYTMSSNGQNLKQITQTAKSEYNAIWRPDGKKIAFMSAEEGSMQIYEMNPDGSERQKISKIEDGISGFKYAPDMSKIVFIKEVKLDKAVKDIYPDLDKADARIIDDLMYRHWDSYNDTYSHIFIAKYKDGKISGEIDIMKDEKFEAPLKPHGGIEQICWSPNGKLLAYTIRQHKGKDYAVSTNSDILVYNVATGEKTNVTTGMAGYDINPVFSPDGTKLAWESMARDGYESDKNRLIIYDMATQKWADCSKDFDQNVAGIAWADNSLKIFFTSDIQARTQIYSYDLASAKFTSLTKGDHDYTSVAVAKDVLIGTKMSISMPSEIFSINPESGAETQISFVNKDLLSQLKMGKVEERKVKTTDNKDMLVWVIYPPNFDPSKKYPTLLYCQGGPQSAVSQFFSYRWNFQMMAANGYIVVAPNRRGLPGFGQAWNEQISKDYGGQNMKDYLAAIDDVAKEPYVDKEHLGAVGASYGGFSVYWLAGHHNKRFRAFIAHDGMFNLENQYLETEEMWFVNWDLGGPFWDKTNLAAQRSYENSPHKFVQYWDTPILVIHGGKDYRIAETQGMQAFAAARMRNIPARFLHLPEENHWVLSPQNSVLWQRVFFDWLDKYLKVK
jgi:dipeptidyl aminopeptidase/acylaminoacyl peptidase